MSFISGSYYDLSCSTSSSNQHVKNPYFPSSFGFLYKERKTEEAALKKLEEVLKTQPNLDEKDRFGNTPLTKAIQLSFSTVAMRLIKAGASVVDLTSEGDALVHVALLYGRKALFYHAVETLKQDINLLNREKETPLQKLFMTQFPLDNRNHSSSLLRYVFSYSNKKVIDQKGNSLLSLYINSKVPLSMKEMVVIHSHLAYQANKKNNAGEIPLNQSVSRLPEQMTNWLLPLTEDPFNLDSRGKPAIITWLRRCNQIPSRRPLKQWGALAEYLPKEKINSTTRGGRSLLHLCARIGLLHAIEELIDKGADPKLRDRNGFNPTFHALAGGSIECFNYLEKLGFGISGIEADERELKPSKLYLQTKARELFSLIHPSSDSQKELNLSHFLNILFFKRLNLNMGADIFEEALSRLIALHGEERFIAACRNLFEEHLFNHFIDHDDNKGLRTELPFFDFSKHTKVLNHILQLEIPFQSFEFCRKYAKNIFKEAAFWRTCKEKHSTVYNALITEIAQKLLDELPNRNENHYRRDCFEKSESPLGKIDLASLLKENCLETYDLICEDLFIQQDIISLSQITLN